jgi:hypothetical protein
VNLGLENPNLPCLVELLSALFCLEYLAECLAMLVECYLVDLMRIGAPIRCSPQLPYQISQRIDLGVYLVITLDFNSYSDPEFHGPNFLLINVFLSEILSDN